MPYERKTVDINTSEKFKNFLQLFKKTSDIADILCKDRVPKDSILENHVDYISISEEDPTKISYLTKERIEFIKNNGECLWTSSKRFHCKPGSFISKILKDIPAKSIETFSNQFKSLAIKQDFRFEVVSGESVKEYYYYETYASQRGSLGASCMKYEKCQSYLGLYSNNQEVVKMLIMKSSNDLILGRALLWDFTWEGNNFKIMDRIYTTKDEDLSLYFKNWADSNGYIHKKNQNWANTMQFEGLDNQEIKVGIKLSEAQFDLFPYLDTFKWVDLKSKIIYNHLPDYFKKDDKYHRILCSPEGHAEYSDFLALDEIDRSWVYKNDIIDVDGIMTSTSNCVWSDTLNKWILRRDSKWSPELRDNIYSDMSRMDQSLLKRRSEFINGTSIEMDCVITKLIEETVWAPV